MKRLALVALCMSMAVISACGGSAQKKVTGSKGDQYTVDKDVKSVGNNSGEKEYESYTITLNLERSGKGQNM